MKVKNPLLNLDYPDIDAIRVDRTYYMISTTMHFMPGAEILKSYDLVHWEHECYVYDRLDSTERQTLVGEENAYGKGMWAASLRYHKGTFYVCFVANDTQKTYLYTTKSMDQPWEKHEIEGFYHDCSLLFDEDDRTYIVYGNKHIYLTELKADLSGPLPGGLHRMVVNDDGNPSLGYEGSHMYKINGQYYLFFIHSLRDRWRRVEACFRAASLNDEFIGGDCLNDDMGYCNSGVAQGGIVDTPDGKWYAILFQDRGAIGRIPVLVPVTFHGNDVEFGVDGIIPLEFETKDLNEGYQYTPLVDSDDFRIKSDDRKKYGSFGFKSCWQFNHEPDLSMVSIDHEAGTYNIKTGKISNLTQAKNTLTQRMSFPSCEASVVVDGDLLHDGDYAGLCALQSMFGYVAITKKDGILYLVMANQDQEWEEIPLSTNRVNIKVNAYFDQMRDEATFSYFSQNEWKKIGITQKLFFKLDHFTGCRFGLFMFSTKETGGCVSFSNFIYNKN